MSESKATPTIGVLLHSFFVVPFIIAMVAVLLFTGMKLLTAEKRTVYDYVEDIRVGGKTKRWQAAYELSKILNDPKEVPTEPRFAQEMMAAFEESKHDDARVRDYLAMAMGRSQNTIYTPVLLQSLKDEHETSKAAIIYALGLLKSAQASQPLAALYANDDAQIRLAVVMALGDIGGANAVAILTRALEDPEPNVRWDAAIGLAKQNQPIAKATLSRMLQRKYWDQFKNVDRDEQNRAIMVAIQSAVLLNDVDLNQQITFL